MGPEEEENPYLQMSGGARIGWTRKRVGRGPFLFNLHPIRPVAISIYEIVVTWMC
ncbi:hypothetical protein [Oryza sativa Japonica Group]|uniref:Uncharacterized protein n=1 Tax=Oryza sativa subsp. japonica TaxID=39947 RepID=Q8LQR1_ORYSJ|nr:hypothetical protein [Oryza sativa Japonica Group]